MRLAYPIASINGQIVHEIEILSGDRLAISRMAEIALTLGNPSETPYELIDLVSFLESVEYLAARDADLRYLKTLGSQSGTETTLFSKSENLWSVLRNLLGLKEIDNRFETIIGFMRKDFTPFQGLVLDQTGNSSVYAQMVEKGRWHKTIPASGMSDGQLQLLINLTTLFSDENNSSRLILIDEPETSLHPHAIAIFAEAVNHAAKEWGRQMIIATHSPVLLSQFEPDQILEAGVDFAGRSNFRRLSEIDEVKDLLDQFAIGSLYMAQAIAPQSMVD